MLNSFGEEINESGAAEGKQYTDFNFNPEQKRALKQELLKARMISQNEKSIKAVNSYANIENF